jgi:type IV pilus assembly protein PilF
MRGYGIVLAIAAGAVLAACAGPSAANRKEAAARMEMGVSYLNQRNLSAAMRELSAAADLDPENPEIDMVLGLAFRARGDDRKAEEHFRRAIRKKPDYSEARNNLGVLLAHLGRSDEALREFESAVSNVLYATPEIGYYNMGEEYRRRNDTEQAALMYRRAIALNERYAPAYQGLAILFSGRGRLVEAAETLARSTAVVPDYAPVWMDLGIVYARMGRHRDARMAFQNVLANTDDPALRKRAIEHVNALETNAR